MTAATATRRAWVEQIMGTPISIHLRGTAPMRRRVVAVEAVYAELRDVDRIFSTYRLDSEISRLSSGLTTVERCDPAVRTVLDLCEQARVRTDGYFDVHLPGPDGVARLDPSGLVKGWAAERAARHLAALRDDDHYVNAGGDIALRCGEGRPPWRIGVEHPDRPGGLVGVVALTGGGIATSGTAHRGAHIVDPTTGHPATAVRAVTVVGPSLLWADVYATAAVARGLAGLDWLAAQDGFEALTVLPDGRVAATTGMTTMLQRHRPPGS
ncbi:MAG TPA: FAD:protein FMN transferase [Asanoa sp.]